MEEWKTYRLGDLCNVKGGKRLPKGVTLITERNSHPYIRIRDLSGKKIIELDNSYEYVDDVTQQTISRYIVTKGNILLSIVGTIGLCSIVGESLDSANLTENCVKLIKLNNIDRDYLYYYLISTEGQNEIKRGTVGAVQPKLPIKNIENIIVPLPPLPLQRRISSLLSSLDAKIETNRKINARLEEMAQALFRSWFIDFTPFKQQEFVEDEYGRRPKGWRFVELGEVTKECKDKVKERTDVKVLSPITTGQLVLSDEYFTKQVYSKDLSKYIIVEPNAFAYNPARVNIGSIGINDHGFEGCVSPVYVVFKTLPNYERFMNLFIKTRAFKEEVLLRAIGGVRQTLNYTEFSLITTNWPPESVILKFNSIYDTIIKSIKQNEQESSRLAALRDTLLPKLMSGELIPEEITT